MNFCINNNNLGNKDRIPTKDGMILAKLVVFKALQKRGIIVILQCLRRCMNSANPILYSTVTFCLKLMFSILVFLTVMEWSHLLKTYYK